MFPLQDPILVFTVLAFGMLIAPLLASRLRIPDLVLLLGIGTLLGPNGLGVLERDSAVTLFGNIGLLYIMFLAGLEIDLHRFSRTKGRSVMFGLLTFAIPQGIGTLMGHFILGFSWTTSMLLASMFASHTLLAYPIASRLGIARREPVAITVGATILTDILALLVLAVIADTARGVQLGWFFWLAIGFGMCVLVTLTWWGIPYLTRWFFKHVTEAGSAQFLFVLVTVCACSYFSHYAKMEPIIGAFLAGAAFNRLIPEHSVLMNRVVFTGNTLFIPFFLISVGMLVDPSALVASPRTWMVAATMVVGVLSTKYTAAWLAAKWFGYDSDSRNVMFGLSVVQAAATLAAVLVGFELNIFDDTILNGAITMIMVTCPLGSWTVARYGRSLATQQVVTRERSSRLEQRLLVPVNQRDHALKLLDLAFFIRDISIPGVIHPVTIVGDQPDSDEAVAQGEKLLSHLLSHAASAEIPIEPSVRVDLNISDGIVRASKELRSGLVLAGWETDLSTRARLFGSIAGRLLDGCSCRVILCRLPKPLNTTRRLLVLFPPLAERRSDAASLLRDIKYLTRQIGAELRVYLAVRDEAGEIHRLIEKSRPSCPTSFVSSETLAEARSRLFEEIAEDDMILLPGERRSGVLWTPSLDKLPEMVVTRFQGNNVLVAYPAMVGSEESYAVEFDSTDSPPFRLVPLDAVPGQDLQTTIRAMTDAAFPNNSIIAGVVGNALQNSAEVYPVELSGGIVLLHTHCEQVGEPTLIVVRGQTPWQFPHIQSDAQIILALVSPKDESADRHLKSLAELARRFYNPELVKQVAVARSARDVCLILERG